MPKEDNIEKLSTHFLSISIGRKNSADTNNIFCSSDYLPFNESTIQRVDNLDAL